MSKDDEFQKVVMEGLVPKLAESFVAVTVIPEDEDLWVDAKFCLELGAMIMLDKPIIALIQPGMRVPEKLRLVADAIVEADLETDEGQAAIIKAMNDIKEREEE